LPVRPSLLEDLLFLKLNRGPGPLFDLFGAGSFRAVAVSIRLGLFESIGARALNSKEIASCLSCDERGIQVLLEFLCSLGYLRKRAGLYENTPLSKKWILKNSDVSLKDMVEVWDKEVFPFWDRNMDAVLKTGSLGTTLYQEFDSNPEAWQNFNAFEMAIANWLKAPLLSQVKLGGNSKRLLDIGGGHGAYSIMACKKYPQLRATIFDKPEALKIARLNVDSSSLGERITLQSGDFLKDDLGEGYDVAFLFNIIHNFREREIVEIFRRTRGALSKRGSIIIFDNIQGPGVSKRTVDFFSLAYLVTVGGRCYALSDLKAWLEDSGFESIRTTFRLPGLVKAIKSG
jgi:ubiquinone/menaquinone biosynthesis C-methylase UbiE